MLTKKVVVVLVVIAIILGVFSVAYSLIDSGDKISTTTPLVIYEDSEDGGVGVNILSSEVSDKDG